MTTVNLHRPAKVAPIDARRLAPKYDEPSDPAIKTKTDIAAVLFVWVGGIFLGLGLISLAAYFIEN